MHVWNPVGNGPVDIICGPLLPSVFGTELALQNPATQTEILIPGVASPDGTTRFSLAAADVQAIKDSSRRLMLRTDQTLIPGSHDPRWGWRYTVVHPPGAMTVTELGAPVALDASGFFKTALTPYPNPPVVLTNKAIDFQ